MNEIALRLATQIFDQPLIGNQYRSAFIEAMIEPYIKPSGWRYTGDGWSGFDFEHSDGVNRLEVKQSAARQTWSEKRDISENNGHENQTRPIFDIAPRKGYFFDGGSKYVAAPGRAAQTCVFAWNPVYDKCKVDHRNPDQWDFYVVPSRELPTTQKTIRLQAIAALTKPVKLAQLSQAIESARSGTSVP